MENIINSFFIKQSKITELTFEFTERLWQKLCFATSFFLELELFF